MTQPGNGQPVVHDVRMSQQTSALVKRLHRQAVEAGAGQQFL
jgi:hypothetical protein